MGRSNTYQYTFSGGDFLPGQITVNIVAGSFMDKAGSANSAATQSLTIYSTTVALSNPIADSTVDVTALNSTHTLDVRFIPVGSATITAGLINGDEFTLSGTALNGVTLASGAPVLVSRDNRHLSFTLS